jgi:hypothetical protein
LPRVIKRDGKSIDTEEGPGRGPMANSKCSIRDIAAKL